MLSSCVQFTNIQQVEDSFKSTTSIRKYEQVSLSSSHIWKESETRTIRVICLSYKLRNRAECEQIAAQPGVVSRPATEIHLVDIIYLANALNPIAIYSASKSKPARGFFGDRHDASAQDLSICGWRKISGLTFLRYNLLANRDWSQHQRYRVRKCPYRLLSNQRTMNEGVSAFRLLAHLHVSVMIELPSDPTKIGTNKCQTIIGFQ